MPRRRRHARERALRPGAARPRPAARAPSGLPTAWRCCGAARARDATPVIVLTARDALGDRCRRARRRRRRLPGQAVRVRRAAARASAPCCAARPGAPSRALARWRLARSGARARSAAAARRWCCRRASSRVLEALMERPGAMLSRAQLEDRLYGWGEEIESNAVSVYIHQLRRKLGADFIRTRARRRLLRRRGRPSRPEGMTLDPPAPARVSLARAGSRWPRCCDGGAHLRNVLAETEALFDYQLRQMALSLRDQGEISRRRRPMRWPTRSSTSWCRSGRSTAAASTHCRRRAAAAAGARAARASATSTCAAPPGAPSAWRRASA